jgi:hypothetical protein
MTARLPFIPDPLPSRATVLAVAVLLPTLYVGTMVLAAGIVVAFNHPAGVAVLAAALAISLHRVRKEEQFLLGRLPDYAQYRREVPAFPTPGSVWRALAGGRLRHPLSLRQCFFNGEMLRLNLYLPLLLAAGFFLGVSRVLLAAGAVLAVLLAVAAARLHPAESRRRRSDYFLPAVMDLAVLALVVLVKSSA